MTRNPDSFDANTPSRCGPGTYTVLALSGSLRRGSYNTRLLRAALSLAPSSLGGELYTGLGALPVFNEDLEGDDNQLGGVRELTDAVAKADALLVATPEYNQSIPAALKNAIDWLSRARGEPLQGKPACVIGASTGPWGTRIAQTDVRDVLSTVGAYVMPGPRLYVANAAARFDANGALTDSTLQERLASLMLTFADWVDRILGTRSPALESRQLQALHQAIAA